LFLPDIKALLMRRPRYRRTAWFYCLHSCPHARRTH